MKTGSLVVIGAVVLFCLVASKAGVVAPGANVEKLSGIFAFTEGPAADPKGNVYFTDQPNDKIYGPPRPPSKARRDRARPRQQAGPPTGNCLSFWPAVNAQMVFISTLTVYLYLLVPTFIIGSSLLTPTAK
jgi:hypothetical protein